ncbi:MAG: hypothetical protein ACHQHP_02965 [Bacteroidia bacterium]
MKKTFQIRLLLFGFIILLFYSCNRDHTDCSQCQITPQEEALLPAYNVGDIAVFKNDTTGVLDTLNITSKSGNISGCSYPCNNTDGSMSIWGIVFHNHFSVGVAHSPTPNNTIPGIGFDGANVNFPVTGSIQSMTINGTTYNDVIITSIDSTKILSASRTQVPWKINYSKSKGFVRLYMLNGQTWSKL